MPKAVPLAKNCTLAIVPSASAAVDVRFVAVPARTTEPVPELAERKARGLKEYPVLRDEDYGAYLREDAGKFQFGPYEFERDLKLFAVDGVPKDFGADLLPDTITIFRLPILRICETQEDVVREVRVTVVHEIAHHFGIDDDRLHELGWG